MIDPQVAIDKLNGMDCEEIRHFMRLESVQGLTSLTGCPIAMWLKKVTGLRTGIAVSGTRVRCVHDVVHEDRYDLAEGPRMFIHHFDREEYPELRICS